ncbi:MAG: hypothetical protein LQ337_001772 [Flavoplaca oasis]|nr:MAG: hypothetical protein LQ337_001772 [Flavoplaca oasis]
MKANFTSSCFHLSGRLRKSTAILRIPVFPALRCIATSSSNKLAQIRSERNGPPELWFCSSPFQFASNTGVAAPGPKADERTLKLGKSQPQILSIVLSSKLHTANASLVALQLLQTRLPTLLTSPLPPEILSPQIRLHLFPSTHPHLPAVSGRVAYHAALWSSPVAWGRVPIVGNVKLVIISERVVKCGPLLHSECSSSGTYIPKQQNERLIVRWKTSSSHSESDNPSSARSMKALYRGIGPREQVNRFMEWLSNPTSFGKRAEEFYGLFIFEFDEQGRIATHTIEHAEENGTGEKASTVVNLTDWLIGRARARREKTPDLVWVVDGQKRPVESRERRYTD